MSLIADLIRSITPRDNAAFSMDFTDGSDLVGATALTGSLLEDLATDFEPTDFECAGEETSTDRTSEAASETTSASERLLLYCLLL